MKHVTDYTPFAEGKQLLNNLQAEYDKVAVDLEVCRSQLREFNIPATHNSVDVIDRATKILNGESVPASMAGADMKHAHESEMQLRERLELLRVTLKDLPNRIERLRDDAAAMRRKELGPEFNKVRANFADATARMIAAIDAEDKLRESMVSGGFGFQEAVLTTPIWLNRNLLLMNRDLITTGPEV